MTKILVILAVLIGVNAYAAETPEVTQLRHDMEIMLAIDSELIVDAQNAVDYNAGTPRLYVDFKTKKKYTDVLMTKPYVKTTLAQRKAYLKRRIEIYNADKKSYLDRIKKAQSVAVK